MSALYPDDLFYTKDHEWARIEDRAGTKVATIGVTRYAVEQLGDVTQVDLPKEQRSGLLVVGDILDGVEDVAFTRFGGEDVVRHKLVQRIVAAYAEHSERQAPELRPADHRRRPA